MTVLSCSQLFRNNSFSSEKSTPIIDDIFPLLNNIGLFISYKISLPFSSLPATSLSPLLTSTSLSLFVVKLK